jgi:hypothetical protein
MDNTRQEFTPQSTHAEESPEYRINVSSKLCVGRSRNYCHLEKCGSCQASWHGAE